MLRGEVMSLNLATKIILTLAYITTALVGVDAGAQEARARAERLELIQREKFDLVLPGAMRDNGVDMWIHVIRDGNPDPLALDWGTPLDLRGTTSYFIFTDCGGDRIERAVLGGHDEGIRASDGDPYDFFGASTDLRRFLHPNGLANDVERATLFNQGLPLPPFTLSISPATSENRAFDPVTATVVGEDENAGSTAQFFCSKSIGNG